MADNSNSAGPLDQGEQRRLNRLGQVARAEGSCQVLGGEPLRPVAWLCCTGFCSAFGVRFS
jgi:hypothetical protein